MPSDYSPLFKPGEALTLTASTAVTGGQLVAVSGNMSVAPTSAATASWLGVAAFSTSSGQLVTVLNEGVQVLIASGSIAAGAPVIAAAAGAVADGSASTTYSQQVGIALNAATNGNPVNVKLTR